jgi:hypothetical protein
LIFENRGLERGKKTAGLCSFGGSLGGLQVRAFTLQPPGARTKSKRNRRVAFACLFNVAQLFCIATSAAAPLFCQKQVPPLKWRIFQN